MNDTDVTGNRIELDDKSCNNPDFELPTIDNHVDDWARVVSERLAQPFVDLQNQLNELVETTSVLLEDRQAQIERRTILFLLSALFAGVAWIFVVHPLVIGGASALKESFIGKAFKAGGKFFAGDRSAPLELGSLFDKPELAKTGTLGQSIGGSGTAYAITDTYKVRMVHPSTGQRSSSECAGKSLEQVDAKGIDGCVAHRGIDIGTPIGTPIYVIAVNGSTAQVECRQQGQWGTYAKYSSPSLPGWEFTAHHLSRCQPGVYKVGSVFGVTGSAGTGAHLHFGTKYKGKWIAPPIGFAQWTLQGEKP